MPWRASKPLREPVVGGVPAQLALERARRGVGVDDDELGARSSRRSPRAPRRRSPSRARCGAGAPAISQASAEVDSDGRGSQTAQATGSCGRSSSGSTTSISLTVSRNRSPRSESPATTPGPGSAVKRSRTGSSRPPMPSGWISSDGLLVVMRRADLEHVGAEDLLLARHQVVGVVLHEGRAAGQPGGHHLHAAQQHRRSSSRPRRRSRSRRPSAAARRGRGAGAARRGPRSSW